MAGFLYALVLEDGEPADPTGFSTLLDGWKAGDTFLAGQHLQRFRILAVVPEPREESPFEAVLVVEPVSEGESASP